jgi:hydroxyacylglutathione hydrolase
VVDPGDARPVNAALQQLQLTLSGIVVTHHHSDHIGGVQALAAQHQVPVWGPRAELHRIDGITHAVSEGDEVWLEAIDVHLQVIEVPGHTSGHIAYYARQAPGRDAPLLLCGDTLFSAGCGRLFEGTPQQMMQSLAKLAALPSSTQVFCTHEYTLSNLAFSCAAEPHNTARDEHHAWCKAQRAAGLPTLPSTLATERVINPFLRCSEPQTIRAMQAHTGHTLNTPIEVFTAMREWKNTFRA